MLPNKVRKCQKSNLMLKGFYVWSSCISRQRAIKIQLYNVLMLKLFFVKPKSKNFPSNWMSLYEPSLSKVVLSWIIRTQKRRENRGINNELLPFPNGIGKRIMIWDLFLHFLQGLHRWRFHYILAWGRFSNSSCSFSNMQSSTSRGGMKMMMFSKA